MKFKKKPPLDPLTLISDSLTGKHQTDYRPHTGTTWTCKTAEVSRFFSLLVTFNLSFHLLITCISYFVARRYLNQGIAPRTVPARYTSHQHNVQEAGRASEARTNSRQLDWPLTTVPSQRSSGKNTPVPTLLLGTSIRVTFPFAMIRDDEFV